jgi:hypothetical protein
MEVTLIGKKEVKTENNYIYIFIYIKTSRLRVNLV